MLEQIARDQGIDAGRLEVWFCDEARVGQKTQLGRRWAKLGTRPVAVLDQRTASTYIFGAICPLHGKAVGLILPECNIEAMNLHLAEIAAAVAPGAHAALIVDHCADAWNKLAARPWTIMSIGMRDWANAY